MIKTNSSVKARFRKDCEIDVIESFDPANDIADSVGETFKAGTLVEFDVFGVGGFGEVKWETAAAQIFQQS